MEQPVPHYFPLIPDDLRLPVDVVFLEIVAQDPFPVGLKRIVDGMPVPVFDHVRAGGQMAVCLQAQLAG